ncbi:hypothetical protein RF11_04364 [Thelohanellus kitauei]|uniref:Uncharacterized protein n=1 Tax=Thelohanellus kitauei TaxID=669202 RepID=A0A0C2MQM0_THEKT|nr:hypothetical protein RF11_04364 [Thelohanellus kitauei]
MWFYEFLPSREMIAGNIRVFGGDVSNGMREFSSTCSKALDHLAFSFVKVFVSRRKILLEFFLVSWNIRSSRYYCTVIVAYLDYVCHPFVQGITIDITSSNESQN